jgi:hypothetical protein
MMILYLTQANNAITIVIPGEESSADASTGIVD